MGDIQYLSNAIKDCRVCIEKPVGDPLPHQPRPVAILSSKAKIKIVGQAPGTRVHASGRPFTDPSGDRLRDWMGIDETRFYDPDKLAIVPMGFCFPGLDAKGGDLPPRKECAPLWQRRIEETMPQVELVLLIGMYAQKFYLGDLRRKTLTETVANWREIIDQDTHPKYLPLPHPSWLNNAWIRKNPWFADELLPELKKQVKSLMR